MINSVFEYQGMKPSSTTEAIFLTIEVLGPFLYVIPTIFMQCALIVIILLPKWKNHFRYGFYRLVCMGLINDLLCFVVDSFGNRIGMAYTAEPYHQFLRQHDILAVSLFTLTHYTYINQAFNAFLISMNRLSAILFPMHQMLIWKKYTDICCICFWIYPLLFVWTVPYCSIIFATVPFLGYHMASIDCVSWYLKVEKATLYNQMFYTLLNMCLNALTIGLLIHKRKQHLNANDQKKRTAEIKLCLYTVVLVSSQAAYSLVTLYINISYNESEDSKTGGVAKFSRMLMWMQYVIDATTLCTTWFLVAMSGLIKKRLNPWGAGSTSAAKQGSKLGLRDSKTSQIASVIGQEVL